LQPDATLIAKVLADAGLRDVSIEETNAPGFVCRVTPEQVADTLGALKGSDHEFTFLVDMFGVDSGEGVDVIYHLRSISRDEEVYVKALHGYGADLASVWTLYPAALMPERECAEMFGLTLSGHPNPKYLLVTEGVVPLLLKSTAIRTAEEVRNR
jgi:NADH:ubiquinone oxidoreductase subunit C